MTEASHEYPSEYHRLVVTGLVDHEWAARLQRAATGESGETIAYVLGLRGFSSNPGLEEAIRNVDWARIRAVAEAFDPNLYEALIC